MRKGWVVKGLRYCLWLPALAFALTTDDTQDIHIQSDIFEYHHQTGIATYLGHVVADQGSRELTGDKLEIFRTPQGDIEKIIIYGNPAKHHSLPNPEKPIFMAQAQTIIYETGLNKITLIENAQVEQDGDIYQAPHIEYDVNEKIVRSPQSNTGRTTITLKSR